MITLLVSISFALCEAWVGPTQVGELTDPLLKEASGLIVEPEYMIHTNDSGDGPFLYISDKKGHLLKKKEISGFQPIDVEDLAETKCGDEDCIVIADIGDNLRLRSEIDLVFVRKKEVSSGPKQISAKHRLKLVYPDGAHNAEGLSFDQEGNLWIVTKEANDVLKKSRSAEVFYLAKDKVFSKKKQVLEKRGILPIPLWVKDSSWLGNIITGFAISHKTNTWVLLTYTHILFLEADWQKNPKDWRKKIFPFSKKKMRQAEAVAFSADGKEAYITTEVRKKSKQPIMKWVCVSDKTR